MNYEKDTKEAYRNEVKAKSYQDQYIKGVKWARFTMWKQKRLMKKMLQACDLKATDKVLDIPCGTGYIGELLDKTQVDIFASDISFEMMALARGMYQSETFRGFVQCDITENPFPAEFFDCVIVLALMHRLPQDVRLNVLNEVIKLSKRFVIVSYSIESPLQRFKQWLLKNIQPSHIPAPSSLPLQDIVQELATQGTVIKKKYHVVYLLSAKIVFLLEKDKTV
jgi:ubiquinone/menaquinone biosynthesis C-methylase UbiE